MTDFAIIDDVIPLQLISLMVNSWMRYFERRQSKERVVWSPYKGQPNSIGYTRDDFQCLYRACQFPWNPKENDPVLKEICSLANERKGIHASDPQQTFNTVSWYPPGSGFMREHIDGGISPLIHALVPLTFRGKDYDEGGLRIKKRNGEWVDIEWLVKPGCVVLYDGTLMHEVLPVYGGIGRMQCFPLANEFGSIEDDPRNLAHVSIGKIVKARALLFKDKIRTLLGREQNYR